MARRLAVPGDVRSTRNPVVPTAEVLAEGMAHFADHCAGCHGADGSGQTEMGRGLYPKAPDMRLAGTQDLSDGELFYVIEHGIRFTGMPGWRTGTQAGEESSWHLVHFIRHLPRLTEAELERMKDLTPRLPDDIRQELEEERFLNGEGTPPAFR
jgi:mono/diheme cytochrome c family protein